MSAIIDPLAGKRRLDSWKEIAAFFGRDERTVKRWEKERSLPVYRVPGSSRGGVFAYVDELTHWLEGSATEQHPTAVPVETSSRAQNRQVAQAKLVEITSPSESNQGLVHLHSPQAISVASARSLLWVAPLAVIILVVILFSTGHGPHFFKSALAASHAPNPEAQDLYLKGRYHWNKRTPDDLNRALDLFTQAIVRDPNYAQAYGGLADCYNLLREFSIMPASEAYPRAIAASRKAVELDPNSADAHTSLAFALFWGSVDVADAEQHFRRALELDPRNTRAHHWYATFLNEIGRNREALDQIEQARQLDPSSTAIMADKGILLHGSHETNQAMALLKQIESTDPEFLSAHTYLAEIYFESKDFANYFRESEIADRIQHNTAAEVALAEDQQAFAADGIHGFFMMRLHRDEQLIAQDQGSEFALASDHAWLGQDSEALQHLRTAVEKHDLQLASLVTSPAFAHLRGSSAFNQLAVKAGLPPITSAR